MGSLEDKSIVDAKNHAEICIIISGYKQSRCFCYLEFEAQWESWHHLHWHWHHKFPKNYKIWFTLVNPEYVKQPLIWHWIKALSIINVSCEDIFLVGVFLFPGNWVHHQLQSMVLLVHPFYCNYIVIMFR